MNKNIKFSKHRGYLLASIPDTVITAQRAQEVLARISDECSSLHYKKVLLDERLVERREVPPHEIMKLGAEMAKQRRNKLYIAFWCQSHLINADSDRLRLYTYRDEYIVKHFSEEEKAVAWLEKQRD